MSSTELTAIPSIAQSFYAHDFAERQLSVKSASCQESYKIKDVRSFSLHQHARDRWTLSPLPGNAFPSYTIKIRQSDGLMHRKPHMIIKRESHEDRSSSVISTTSTKSYGNRRKSSIFGSEEREYVAEICFDHNGAGKDEILYGESGQRQTFVSSINSDTLEHVYTCVILGQRCCWRPLGPSRTVVELINEAHERMALFTYTNEHPWGRILLGLEADVGGLHVIYDTQAESNAQEELLCSALAMVERAKRRAASARKA